MRMFSGGKLKKERTYCFFRDQKLLDKNLGIIRKIIENIPLVTGGFTDIL